MIFCGTVAVSPWLGCVGVGVLQFGGVPVWPAGQVAAGGVLQFGGVPVWPAGQVAGGVVQFGGVPTCPAGQVAGAGLLMVNKALLLLVDVMLLNELWLTVVSAENVTGALPALSVWKFIVNR